MVRGRSVPVSSFGTFSRVRIRFAGVVVLEMHCLSAFASTRIYGFREDPPTSPIPLIENKYGSSLTCYFLQDGFDLVTGNWTHRPGANAAASLWLDDRPLLIRSVSVVSACSCFVVNVNARMQSLICAATESKSELTSLCFRAQMPPLASMSLFMICAGLTLPRSSGS